MPLIDQLWHASPSLHMRRAPCLIWQVFDSTTIGSARSTVEELRGPVTARMEAAQKAAEKGGAWGGKEARALEKRLATVESTAPHTAHFAHRAPFSALHC